MNFPEGETNQGKLRYAMPEKPRPEESEPGFNKSVVVIRTFLSARRVRTSIFAALCILGMLAVVTVTSLLLSGGVSEPKYEGIPLSSWLDGTMAKRTDFAKTSAAMRSVGPDAVPWLI